MTYMDQTFGATIADPDSAENTRQGGREAVVLVIEDDASLSSALRNVCECLNVFVERMPSRDELGPLLHQRHPMAVVAQMDTMGQDGCHVLMTVSAHDRDLPVLLIIGDDPALLGAADAVEEIWRLSSVDKWPQLLGVGEIVDFLFRAGHKGGCLRFIST
jgi:hypothetical protein